MANISGCWLIYPIWAVGHYLVWFAHGGLIAAFTLAFALVLKQGPMESHREKARLAAAGYAPAPEAPALMCGVIGMALFSVGVWGAGRFYDLPLIPHLSLVVAGSLIAFPMGIWLRKKRKRRRVVAYQAEFVRLREEPS